MTKTSATAEAELSLALLMCLARDIPRLSDLTKQGKWARTIFHELPGRTLGLVGFGPGAQALVEMIGGFGLRCMAYDAQPDTEAAKRLGVRLTSLDEVLRESHYVSLHLTCDGTDAPVITAAGLAAMRDGSFLVNVSNESLVDTAAAGKALESGKLAGFGVGLDKATADHPLYRFENFICVPRAD